MWKFVNENQLFKLLFIKKTDQCLPFSQKFQKAFADKSKHKIFLQICLQTTKIAST